VGVNISGHRNVKSCNESVIIGKIFLCAIECLVLGSSGLLKDGNGCFIQLSGVSGGEPFLSDEIFNK
jgi:hypothetical protein